ncbi:MAG: threonylcarbamoyl-AMP synthase [Acidobacteria bacterium]|nr:threonylcarbamoyl-AMP synthase [Acidobacteriota bacterium]
MKLRRKAAVLKLDPWKATDEEIDRVAAVLRGGGVIVYPTDTVYGIGCNPYRDDAVERIYSLKGREERKPFLLLVSDADMVGHLARPLPPLFRKLTDRFWPGPLTLVLPASPIAPLRIANILGTVAVRHADFPFVNRLIERCRFPLVSTSANLAGQPPLTDGLRAAAEWPHGVDLVVDGGVSFRDTPSTVVDLCGGEPRVLREGAIPRATVQEACL